MSNDIFIHDIDDGCVLIDVMGFNYFLLRQHHFLNPIGPKDLDLIKNEIEKYLSNKSDINTIFLDGRGNARYSAKLCRNIAIRLPEYRDKIVILSSMPPEIELAGINVHSDNFNVIVDYYGTCNWRNFYDDLEALNLDWSNIELQNIALTLCNRPSEYRANYVKELYKIAGDRLVASFGSREMKSKGEEEYYSKLMHPLPFPIYIDGPVDRSPLKQHVPPGMKVLANLVQIVQESFEHHENGVFLTEKTFKCFAWHQLPIFVATPGHVSKVRELGFDVFDDIFDRHVYDKQTSIFHYQLKVLHTFKKFLEKYPTLEDCKNLRKELWPRLEENNRKLRESVKNNKSHRYLRSFLAKS